jgi:hypothetical protein
MLLELEPHLDPQWLQVGWVPLVSLVSLVSLQLVSVKEERRTPAWFL